MWYQIQMSQLPRESVDAVSDQLEELGAVSITLVDQNDHPILEPAPGTTPLWPEIKLTALFTAEDMACLAQKICQEQFPDYVTTLDTLPDQVWERVCMDQFQAQRFGEKLWICPSWCEPPCPDAITVFLDPGLAFGTGTHPTTALCLQWLASQALSGKSLIDYGCGSGILAVTAAKLGANPVSAVDIDPQALLATQDNAQKNDCLTAHFKIGAPESIATTTADILMANILLAPLQELCLSFARLLHPKGLLVVSGLLQEQASGLIAHYQPHFRCLAQQSQGEWALLVFEKQSVNTACSALTTP
ncbi:MAG: 50S ribosomal protein L11 methyltransferase [Legionellaceae bacterium]|nr:50S ribosomal protein L11 methyltransferase [Legionellaceae bacterium]